MGKEPLPADLRLLCDCSAGCTEPWLSPEKRYWIQWDGSDDPGLAAAVFIELDPSPTPVACTWLGVVDQPSFFDTCRLFRSASDNVSDAFSDWTVSLQVLAVLVAENTAGFGPLDDCTISHPMPEVFNSTPLMVGTAVAFPILWWQDADDVRPT